MGHTLLKTGVQQCFQRLCAHLLFGENDTLHEPVAGERLDFLGTLVWRIGDVTEVFSPGENQVSVDTRWRIGEVTEVCSPAENLKCLWPRAPSLGAQR